VNLASIRAAVKAYEMSANLPPEPGLEVSQGVFSISVLPLFSPLDGLSRHHYIYNQH
jgi:hypothetical protein